MILRGLKKIKSEADFDKKLDYMDGFGVKNIKKGVSDSKIPYLLFNSFYVLDKYDLDFLDVFVIIYLNELGVFSLSIDVLERRINIGHLLEKGFVKLDYSFNKKKLYSLSDKGCLVIDDFNKSFKNQEVYKGKNRKTDFDSGVKISSVLDRYLNKKSN